MSDTFLSDSASPTGPPALPDPRPGQAPASRPRRWDWRPKLRWFAAEILIVVAGVLIALALNAWWGNRQDAAREQSYLRQLAADLQETERLMQDTDALLGPSDRAGTLLVHAFYLPDPPSSDSLATLLWTTNLIRQTLPVLSTAEALVATGDLGLIRDDSLRSAITGYLDANRGWGAFSANEVADWLQTIQDLYRVVDIDALGKAGAPDPFWPLPPGELRVRYPFDAEALLADREALAILQDMNWARRNVSIMRTRMRESATALREHVEAELNP